MNLLEFTFLQAFLALAVKAQDNAPCDAACIAEFKEALNGEEADWAAKNFLDDPFYYTPENTTGAQPGDLLRWEDLTSDQLAANWTKIPDGMSLSRMIYMTEDIDRNPIPASAFILLPYSAATVESPNATVFRTIAWAHGTSGYSRQCAPSNNQELWYGWEAPFFYASNGYAVIATDYAGMGTDIPGGFQYEAGYLHAADIAYSLVAARKMIGCMLSEDWVVIGHSEGGMSAWRTNERLAMSGQEQLLEAGNFLGAVAAAPALKPYDLIAKSFELAGDGPLAEIVSLYLLESVSNIYPELALDQVLTDELQAVLSLANKGCLSSGEVLVANFTVDEMYTNRSWVMSPQFEDWQYRINGAGPYELAAPMLVVQGLNDTITYAENTEWDFNLTCEAFPQSAAELFVVPELDHDPSFQAAQPYYLRWVDRLFAGYEVDAGCKKTRFAPVNDRFQRVYSD